MGVEMRAQLTAGEAKLKAVSEEDPVGSRLTKMEEMIADQNRRMDKHIAEMLETIRLNRFERVFDDPIAELEQLKETNGIVEYHKKFELLRTRVNLTEDHLVRVYLDGLQTDTQVNVQMFQPQTVEQCLLIGRLYEQAHRRSNIDDDCDDDQPLNGEFGESVEHRMVNLVPEAQEENPKLENHEGWEQIVILEVDGDVEKSQNVVSNTKLCSAHQVFDQMPSKEKQRKCLKAWKFKFKSTSKRSKSMDDMFSFVEEAVLLKKDPKETIWGCVKKEFKETMAACGKNRVDRFKLAEEKESRLQVLDLNQTFMYHQIGHGVDILLVSKMVVHDKEMAVVLQRATSLIICDFTRSFSQANYVWKPGGLTCIQDQWDWLSHVHTCGIIVKISQRLYGTNLSTKMLYSPLTDSQTWKRELGSLTMNSSVGLEEWKHGFDIYGYEYKKQRLLLVIRPNRVWERGRLLATQVYWKWMKLFADHHRTEKELAIGNYVYVKLQPYRQQSVVLRSNQKLAPKYYGPYKIVDKCGAVAYRLQLPRSSLIYPVFHVSQLKVLVGNAPTTTDLPSVLQDAFIREPEYILERKMVKRQSQAVTKVLVKWVREPVEEATWEFLFDLKQKFPGFEV